MTNLLIDGTNLFYRNYTVNPAISPNGEHVGGLVGTLQSLNSLINRFRPKDVVVVWDSPGGCHWRKEIYPEYKAGRKPVHMNRQVDLEVTDEEERLQRIKQFIALVEVLNTTDVSQMMIEGEEADDILHALALSMENPLIVSTDKDFLQLVPGIKVFSPFDNDFVTEQTLKDKYEGILAENFLLARTLLGDSSDNLPGVSRLGWKTLVKGFPKLLSEKQTIEDVFIEAAKNKKSKICQNILDSKDLIDRNQKLMPLSGQKLVGKIKELLEENNNKTQANKIQFHIQLQKHGGRQRTFDHLEKFRKARDE